MNRIDARLQEIEHAEVHRQLYQDPLKWIGKWMLVKSVYLVYVAVHLALYIGTATSLFRGERSDTPPCSADGLLGSIGGAAG